MTTQPFTGGDYSSLSQWAAGLKPHYIASDYGFNPEPDIDRSTGPRQDIRSLNRRGLDHGPLKLHTRIQTSFTCQGDRQPW